jgi:cell division protein ZipA
MNDLRLSLIVIGVIIVAIIYLSEWLRRRHRARYRRLHDIDPDDLPDIPAHKQFSSSSEPVPEPTERVPAGPVHSKAHAAALSNEDKQALKDMGDIISEESAPVAMDHLDDFEIPTFNTALDATSKPVVSATEDDRDTAPEVNDFIVINVAARDPAGFQGRALRNILRDAGLEFGPMNIFHYYKIGASEPVFSLANMVEPGVFDVREMTRISIPGVVLFMACKGDSSDVADFDQMIDVAKTLAEKLDGRMKDQSHSSLSSQGINAIRESLRSRLMGLKTAL